MTRKRRKGQVFMMDYLLGTLMFFALAVMGVVLFVQIVPADNYEKLYADNTYISQMLMSPGYPHNWTNVTVVIPGIADDFRLNISKLHNHDKLGYDETRSLLQTTNDYLFFFENKTHILNLSNCTHGFEVITDPVTCEPDMDDIAYNDLVKTTRLLAHNGTMVTFVLYTWK